MKNILKNLIKYLFPISVKNKNNLRKKQNGRNNKINRFH